MSVLDWLSANWPVLVLLSSYPIGATIHIVIAYRTIKKESDRARAETLRIIREEVLPVATRQVITETASMLADLRKDLPVVPEMPTVPTIEQIVDAVTAAIPDFPEMPAVPSAEQIATAVTQGLQMKLYSEAGKGARVAQSTLERVIGGMSTGNPTVDGLLNLADANGTYRKQFAKRIATAIRKGGVEALDESPSGEEPQATDDGMPGRWR